MGDMVVVGEINIVLMIHLSVGEESKGMDHRAKTTSRSCPHKKQQEKMHSESLASNTKYVLQKR